MKKNDFKIYAIFILVIFLLLFKVYLDNRIPSDQIMVNQSMVDSLDAYIALADSLEHLATMTPDTVYSESIVYTSQPVDTVTTPNPNNVKSDTIVYRDSVYVEDSIDVKILMKVAGNIVGDVRWTYVPVVKHQIRTIERMVPYPVIKTVNKEVPKYMNGHYLSLSAGGNDKLFIFGLDYDYVTKNRIYGLQYRRYGDSNVYGVKVGINLNTLFKN